MKICIRKKQTNKLGYAALLSSLCILMCVAQTPDQSTHSQPLALEITAKNHSRMNVLIGVINQTAELVHIAQIIKKDFENAAYGLHEHYAVTIKPVAALHSMQEMRDLFAQGYHVALFLSADDPHHIAWRLYTHDRALANDKDEAIMLEGKKYAKRGGTLRGWAHNIADAVRFDLTGNPGFFSTKIAYCKDVVQHRKQYKYIYIADFDGSHEELLVSVPTINVAPRWNRDTKNPLLFYSEATNQNMRLMAVNMGKQRRIASNFDGLNMLPTFSGDGKKVVFCASRGKGNCELYYYEKGSFKQLTKNGGNNVSPTLTADGNDLYFCSDFKTGAPQIYLYHMSSKELTPITDKGYCTSPCYSDANGMIAYTKNVLGTMQLFLCKPLQKHHRQLTFDAGNKDECSWSPCGNYLLYSVDTGATRRIALMNINSGKQKLLVTGTGTFSYPTWSPVYEQYPVVG